MNTSDIMVCLHYAYDLKFYCPQKYTAIIHQGLEREMEGGTIIIDSNTLIKRTIDFCLLSHDKR